MSKTFGDLVKEIRETVPAISLEDAQKLIGDHPNTLIIDVRDAWNIRQTGIIAGAIPISVGMLGPRADQTLEKSRDPRLKDRTTPIITACNAGAMASIGAKILSEMGFTNVHILNGGTVAWKEAGLPIEQFDGK